MLAMLFQFVLVMNSEQVSYRELRELQLLSVLLSYVSLSLALCGFSMFMVFFQATNKDCQRQDSNQR